jgi:hypothetical protein
MTFDIYEHHVVVDGVRYTFEEVIERWPFMEKYLPE